MFDLINTLDALDSVFGNDFSCCVKENNYSAPSFPPSDMIQKKDGTVEISLALAGYSKENIEITTEENKVVISTVKDYKRPEAEDGTKVIIGNIKHSAFTAKFVVPETKFNFADIKDCYIKMMSPINLLPMEIMDEVIGYYYIIEEDITPLAGILTSTMYYDRFDQNRSHNNVLNTLAETIVRAFDKKFLVKNMKFKRLIVEAITYYKLHNKRVRFQFIPKEYICPFKVNRDEHGRGVSILQDSLFYAKLYLMHLLFKEMTMILNSNDTKVNYVRQSGIDKNIANKIQDIIRIKQQRQITLQDMFSYTTLINKIGQGAELYIPVGKNEVRGIETEILSGQDVDMNTPFMELLKKSAITATPVPDALLALYNDAEFAKQIEMSNNRFRGTIVSFQLTYNVDITEWYRHILRHTTSIPESVISAFKFNFIKPKHGDGSVTAELIQNHEAKQNFITQIYYGQNQDDEEIAPAVDQFKKLYAKEKLQQLGFAELDELYIQANILGQKERLNPEKSTENEE